MIDLSTTSTYLIPSVSLPARTGRKSSKRRRTIKAVSKPTLTTPNIKALPDSVLQTVVAAFFDCTSMINMANTCRQFRVITQQTCLSVNHRGNREYLAGKLVHIIDLPNHVDHCFNHVIMHLRDKWHLSPKALEEFSTIMFSETEKRKAFIVESSKSLKLRLLDIQTSDLLFCVGFFSTHRDKVIHLVNFVEDHIENELKGFFPKLSNFFNHGFQYVMSKVAGLEEYRSGNTIDNAVTDNLENREFLAHQFASLSRIKLRKVKKFLDDYSSNNNDDVDDVFRIKSEVQKKELECWLQKALIPFENEICAKVANTYPFQFLKDLVLFEQKTSSLGISLYDARAFGNKTLERNQEQVSSVIHKNSTKLNAYGDPWPY